MHTLICYLFLLSPCFLNEAHGELGGLKPVVCISYHFFFSSKLTLFLLLKTGDPWYCFHYQLYTFIFPLGNGNYD